MDNINFEWDENKNQINQKKHKISFALKPFHHKIHLQLPQTISYAFSDLFDFYFHPIQIEDSDSIVNHKKQRKSFFKRFWFFK